MLRSFLRAPASALAARRRTGQAFAAMAVRSVPGQDSMSPMKRKCIAEFCGTMSWKELALGGGDIPYVGGRCYCCCCCCYTLLYTSTNYYSILYTTTPTPATSYYLT